MKKFLAILCTVFAIVTSTITLCGCKDNVDTHKLDVDIQELSNKCNEHCEFSGFVDGSFISVNCYRYSVYVRTTNFDAITVDTVENNQVSLNVVYADIGQGGYVEIADEDADETQTDFVIIGIPESWNNCTLNVSTQLGDVKVYDCNFFNLYINAPAGHVTVDQCTAREGIDVKALCGDVYVSCNADSVSVYTRGGNVYFETEATYIRIISDDGEINGKIIGRKDTYNIDINTVFGRCNVENQIVDSDNTLYLSTYAGSIKVSFNKNQESR